MKFLYLKGTDIYGPFEVEEIVKADYFSDDLLVCPENQTDQGDAWKPAAFYTEFKKALEKEIFPIKESKPIVNESVAENKEPKQEIVDILQDFAPLENTETANTTTISTDSSVFDEVLPSFEQVMEELSVPKNQQSEEYEEDVQDHTFHIAHKEDNLLEDLPAHSLLGPEPSEEENEEDEDVQDHTKHLPVIIGKTQETNNVQGGRTDLLEISNNQIISSSDGRIQKRKPNDLIFILYITVIVIVTVAVCMAIFNNTKDKRADVQKIEEAQPAADNSSKTSEEAAAKEKEPVKTAEVKKELTQEEKVIEIVKNTKLENKGKTVGEYLQSVYGKGYQSSWSAKPFTDNVYIVEFFASQVRSEPYVYLFRVDIDKQKITGALNNITLDLLS